MGEPRALYNEIDPYAADWIRNLAAAGHVAPGEVDTRSVVDLRPADVAGYAQFHTFAGIAGWSLALRLAGVPDDFPVWTGSCPCQPFSAAGRRGGFSDERHLWPAWFELINACRPALVFGEQVASKDGLAWLDAVFADLEGAGYACRALIIPAYSVGAPHRRERIWLVAYSPSDGCEGIQRRAAPQVQENRALETLGAWNSPGDPFTDWKKLLAGAEVRRLANGVSSNLVVRPALRAYGNAIVPQVAATFIGACLDALTASPLPTAEAPHAG